MDFNQGKITTLHDFTMDFSQMKTRLNELKSKYPAGIIIPLHEKDLNDPNIKGIITCLNKCNYLQKVFIALSADRSIDYNKAKNIFSAFQIPWNIIWCNKPEVKFVLEELKEKGLDVTKSSGKGKDLWLAIGIASLELYAMAVHDADIVYYSEMLPTKLLYSAVEPRMDFFFSKGYYARLNFENKRVYGRIHRLFISPILEALQKKLDHRSSFIRYLQSYKYPLSGEIAVYSDVALNLRIPGDWGLELGMLAEIYRTISVKRICDMDLGYYDHNHKQLSSDALLKTAEDCFITLLRTLTEVEGINVSEAFLLSLQVVYRRFAQDKIRQYSAEMLCNSLVYDRHEEETNVDLLSDVIMRAGKKYLEHPTASQLPDWQRVISAMPDARERLRNAAIER